MKNESNAVIILDTDVGLDDAAAILLAQEIGIHPAYYVCTEGNTTADGVLRNVTILSRYLGLNARTVKGCETHPERAGDFFGEDGLGNLSRRMMADYHIGQEEIRASVSYEAFRQDLLRYDHITYIAIGPLITLSDLIRDEEIRTRIDDLYIMGGGIRVFNAPNDSEFNFHDNPKAVQEVLASGLNLTLFPLDLTIRQTLNEGQIAVLEATGRYPEYIKMFRFVKERCLEYDGIDAAILHDTMPILYCAYSQKFTAEDIRITCDSNGHLEAEERGTKVHLVTGVEASLLHDSMMHAFREKKADHHSCFK